MKFNLKAIQKRVVESWQGEKWSGLIHAEENLIRPIECIIKFYDYLTQCY